MNNFDLDSFERFCDDLCEVLLSFLPISDKIKFECLSKQWNRLVFNRKQKLIITYSEDNEYTIKRICYDRKLSDDSSFTEYRINTILLEKLLPKFKFITHLEINMSKDSTYKFHFEPKELELIGTYCKFLKRFECECSAHPFAEKDFTHFRLKCGQRLEYFGWYLISGRQLRAFMPSINKIKASHLKVYRLNAEDFIEEIFPKVEEIGFQSSDLKNMVLFTDNFHSKIKKLCIHFDRYYMTQNKNNDYLRQIYRFKELKNLKLNLNITD